MDSFVTAIEDNISDEIIEGALGDSNIEFMLGAIIDSDEVVLMSICLVKCPVDVLGDVYDLRFGIRIKSTIHTWRVTSMDFTQSTARRFVAREDRSRVLGLVLRAITMLVRQVRPNVLTMSTFEQELPDKALVKYGMIGTCLVAAGYRTEEAYKDISGRYRWVFVLAA